MAVFNVKNVHGRTVQMGDVITGTVDARTQIAAGVDLESRVDQVRNRVESARTDKLIDDERADAVSVALAEIEAEDAADEPRPSVLSTQ
jgi:hypothetical protein